MINLTHVKQTLLLALIITIISTNSYAQNWQTNGERLSYNINYLGLKAGEAEILLENDRPNNKYRIVARAWTKGFLGSMVKIKDRLTVQGEHTNFSGKFAPNIYLVNLNENDYSANKKVEYIRTNLAATYYNVKQNTGPTEYKINWQTRDMLSALYYLRDKVKTAKVGSTHKVPVFDLTTHYTLNLNIVSREKMKTKLGNIDVLHVQPILEGLKDRNKDDKWHLWITADEERIPVKIKVKLKVGSFTATLRNVSPAKSGSRAPADLPLVAQLKQ